MNVVPCIKWIRRGVAKRNPDRVKLDGNDLKRLIGEHGDKLEELEDSDRSSDNDDNVLGEGSAQKRKKGRKEKSHVEEKTEEQSDTSGESESEEDVAKKYGLDDYDEENSDEEAPLAVGGITTFPSSKDDPYLDDEDEDSEAEELEILPDDSLIAVAKVHGDYNTLEVHVYEEEASNMYCHHDVLLPVFPLAIEWLDFDPSESKPGNYLAMGSMEPSIDIWDMDVTEAMEPAFTLAGISKKKGKKKKKVSAKGHSDAVLTLSWNQKQRQVLASGSADCSIGLWDLQEGVMASSISMEEKVQSIEWHPFEPQSLLAGSFDKTARVFDCRSASESNKSWSVSADVEQVRWNRHNPYHFLAATEDGKVFCMDVRTDREPVATWEAHAKATTGLAIDHHLPGCVVTVSGDKTLKVWDIRQTQPDLVLKKSLNMGDLHCVDTCMDSPLLIAVGGEREHRVLNLKKNPVVSKHWNLTAEEEGGEETAAMPVVDPSDESDVDEETKKEAAAFSAPLKKKKKLKKKKQSNNAS